MKELIEELKEVIDYFPCRVAREGELTIECRIDNICDCCKARSDAGKLIKKIEKEFKNNNV